MKEKGEIEREIIKLNEERDNLSYKIKELNYELNKNKQHFIERKLYNNYYVITDDYNLTYSIEKDSSTYIDDNYYNDFNYFHTEQEAIKYLNHIKLSLKILRARDFVNGDWKPDYNKNKINVGIFMNLNNEISYKFTDFKIATLFRDDSAIREFRKLITDEEIIEFLSF